MRRLLASQVILKLFYCSMQAYDVNLDGQLNRDEFAGFIQELTAEAFKTITKTLIAALVVTPSVALMTKRTTEGVPGVGKVVQGIPNSIYASVITFVVLMLQNSGREFE